MPSPSKFDDALAHSLLDLVFSAATYTPPTTWYLAALLASDTEVSASGYARLAVTNNATNFPAASSRTKLLHILQQFVAANPAVDWGTVESIGFYTASSGGTRQLKIIMGDVPLNFTAAASTDVLTSAAHGLVANQRVRVDTLPGLSLPTGLSTATDYFATTVTTNTLKLSATNGGSAIDLTADGAGVIFIWRSKDIADGDILNLNADDLKVIFA